MTSHAAGTFCWMEHDSRDREAAEAFYGNVMGWEIARDPIGGGFEYSMIRADGRVVGGMWHIGGESPADAPTRWTLHVAVDSVDDARARATEMGATVLMEPHDVMGLGRLVLIRDPAGADIGLWQAGSFAGFEDGGDWGTLVWADAAVADLDAARDFYCALFGWQSEEMQGEGRYVVFNRDGAPVAGAMENPAAPGWTPYLSVDDVDAAGERATAAGGTIAWGPEDTPYGRIISVVDPTGAAVNIIRPARGADAG